MTETALNVQMPTVMSARIAVSRCGGGRRRMKTDAVFSENRLYRYRLRRIWDENKSFCMFIGFNPSTADELHDDPTIRRCAGFAKSWGYGGIAMMNLYAFRSPYPRRLLYLLDPIGPDCDRWLVKTAQENCIIICCWGAFYLRSGNRGHDIYNLLGSMHPLYHLGLTKWGCPKHPLYLSKTTKPTLWTTEGP